MDANDESDINFEEIPLNALSPRTRDLLGILLDPEKCILSEDYLYRDWRGLFHESRLPQDLLYNKLDTSHNPTYDVIKLMITRPPAHGSKCDTFGKFQNLLALIDRYDVLADVHFLFVQDARHYLSNLQAEQNRIIPDEKEPDAEKPSDDDPNNNDELDIITMHDMFLVQQGLPLQQYDAFVLFAEEDNLAINIIETIEGFGYKLCVTDRDILGGVSFVHSAIGRLLSTRCNRLIVILSTSFIQSPHNDFVSKFAHSLGINERKRKIVPCIAGDVLLDLPEIFKYIHLLNYERSMQYANFWDKLKKALQPAPDEKLCPRIIITDETVIPESDIILAPPPSFYGYTPPAHLQKHLPSSPSDDDPDSKNKSFMDFLKMWWRHKNK